MNWTVHHGNSRQMAELDDDSVDAVVTDPPYGLGKPPDMDAVLRGWLEDGDAEVGGGGFMGESWDAFVPPPAHWREVLRVMKPGAYAMVFAGARTVDVMGLALRLAGFEIVDGLQWIYGQKMPLGCNIGKMIDRAAGAEREVVGRNPYNERKPNTTPWDGDVYGKASQHTNAETAPATELARRFDGYHSRLRPAYEPIILARKPTPLSYAANAAEHGVAGLNIDDNRIPRGEITSSRNTSFGDTGEAYSGGDGQYVQVAHTKGGFPCNVVMDGDAAAMLDVATEDKLHSAGGRSRGEGIHTSDTYAATAYEMARGSVDRFGDDGGASRFFNVVDAEPAGGASRFFYTALANRREREAGCELLAPDPKSGRRNSHVTVKPVAIMEHLVGLVAPPGDGVILDPFAGSGTTGIACVRKGVRFVGYELEPRYVDVARHRIAHAAAEPAPDPIHDDNIDHASDPDPGTQGKLF